MALGLYVQKMLKYLPTGSTFVMGSACVVVMNEQNQFLLTQRADNKMWDFPGGGCEEADTYKQTAVKEAKEEINLDITEEDLDFLGIISDPKVTTMTYTSSKTKYHVCVFGVLKDNFTPSFTDGEVINYEYVNLQDLLNYDLTATTKYIAQQLQQGQIPFVN